MSHIPSNPQPKVPTIGSTSKYSPAETLKRLKDRIKQFKELLAGEVKFWFEWNKEEDERHAKALKKLTDPKKIAAENKKYEQRKQEIYDKHKTRVRDDRMQWFLKNTKDLGELPFPFNKTLEGLEPPFTFEKITSQVAPSPAPVAPPTPEPKPVPESPKDRFDENELNRSLQNLANSNMVFIVKSQGGKNLQLSYDSRNDTQLGVVNETEHPVKGYFKLSNLMIEGNEDHYIHLGTLAVGSKVDGSKATGRINLSAISGGNFISFGSGDDKALFVENISNTGEISDINLGAGTNEVITNRNQFNLKVNGSAGNDSLTIKNSGPEDWTAISNPDGSITLTHKDGGSITLINVEHLKFKRE